MLDLFEHYEQIPVNLQSILNKYEDDFNDGNYSGLKLCLKECQKIGFTFEFGLDGVAYLLRPIVNKSIIEKAYINYFNNFLTVQSFADHYNICTEKANKIINLGRKINNLK